MAGHAITLGGQSYPVVLPNIRDPRLHVAAVTLTVHALGQIGLGFVLSVPQILASILTAAVVEVGLTFRTKRAFIWPASAMATGSGVALILRVVGTPPGDHWSTYAWWVYAAVAGLSVLTKSVIKFRGSHIFNPSNFGLAVTFLLLGSTRVEPLDFWWAPLNGSMIAAYIVIIGGGALIAWRLHFLASCLSFWVTFAIGLGILAGSGHCMVARWAFAPVCGDDYWRVIVTSPEVMVFTFFMITDPRTVPAGRVGRIVFGALVAIACVVLMAPQTDEFGAKVGLLAGLTFFCAIRFGLRRLLPEPGTAADSLRAFATRVVTGGNPAAPAWRRLATVGVGAAAAVLVAGGVVAAGTPARGLVLPNAAEILAQSQHVVDPATLPPITIRQDVADWNHELAASGMQDVALTLAENLALENQALLQRNDSLLTAVDHGDRLDEMRARLHQAISTGTTVIDQYRFDSLDVSLLVPFGQQTGLSLGFAGRGTMLQQTYDASGKLESQQSSPFRLTFAVRRATGGRWLDVAVLPPAPVN